MLRGLRTPKKNQHGPLSAFIERMRPVPGIKGEMNARPRRALDAGPWPLKKPLYPVIIERGLAAKANTRARLRGGR
jgi:hypothetical protein